MEQEEEEVHEIYPTRLSQTIQLDPRTHAECAQFSPDGRPVRSSSLAPPSTDSSSMGPRLTTGKVNIHDLQYRPVRISSRPGITVMLMIYSLFTRLVLDYRCFGKNRPLNQPASVLAEIDHRLTNVHRKTMNMQIFTHGLIPLHQFTNAMCKSPAQSMEAALDAIK
ncbi:hypothetical protein M0R45_028243 [Rubus argutus]|uniref:Uncharacterized protein n=1 Tax=Rubus argutus TaxID=59490 RepID=A0AAW1W4S5_RUBAR